MEDIKVKNQNSKRFKYPQIFLRIFKYEVKMGLKQISLTMPENLLQASREYSEQFGYKNVQEFILDLVRDKIMLQNIERYRKIDGRMKKGLGVKKFSQKGAVKYIKEL